MSQAKEIWVVRPITAHAIETLLAFGGYEPQINKGVDWLRKAITPEGYWSTYGCLNSHTAHPAR